MKLDQKSEHGHVHHVPKAPSEDRTLQKTSLFFGGGDGDISIAGTVSSAGILLRALGSSAVRGRAQRPAAEGGHGEVQGADAGRINHGLMSSHRVRRLQR